MMRARGSFSQTRTTFSPASKDSSRTLVDWAAAAGFIKTTYDIGKEVGALLEIEAASAKIYSKLTKAPFSPPKPSWGPVFERPAFKAKLLRSVETGLYHVYYGPSTVGKTVAVKSALEGKAGAVYVSLRQLASDEKVFERFAAQIGYFGDQESPLQVGPEVISRFEEAVQLFNKKTSTRVLLVVDDIHVAMKDGKQRLGPNTTSLCAALVDMYNSGQLSVLYVVSDYAAIGALKAVSGHSYRLSASLFPPIPDDEMVEHVVKCAVGKKIEYHEKEKAVTTKVLQTVGWEKETTGIPIPHEDARSIVLKLDSHLGDATACLRMVLEDRMTPADAVTSLVRDAVPLLRPALIGDLDARGGIDEKTFVLTANFLFEKLSEFPDKKMRWTSILDTYTDLVQDEAKKVVNKLVAQNLLTFVDDVTVKIHSRRLHSAYVDVLKRDEDVIRAMKTHSKPPETKN